MVTGILFVVYLLLGRVVPWSLAVTMTLLFGRKQKMGFGLVLVGLIGLIEDVAGVRPLGVSSAILFGLSGLGWFIHRQYQGLWVWWYVLGAGGEVGYRLATGGQVTWQAVVWQLVALWLIRWLLSRAQQPEGIYVGR